MLSRPSKPAPPPLHAPDHDADQGKRTLCGAIFNDPSRITSTLSHQLTGRLVVEPHRHADLLQLDLIVGCRGRVTIEEQDTPVQGITLMSAYPGQRHGYTLEPDRPVAEVWLIKIRPPRGWPAQTTRPLPELLTGLGPIQTLQQHMARCVNAFPHQINNTAALCQLATLLSLWPTSALIAELPEPVDAPVTGNSASARVRRAVQTLGQRYDQPPSLEELAKAAHLSPRHFARRFLDEFGCTPHQYISRRRLDAARGLLLRRELSVSEVAPLLGFNTVAAFSRWFTRHAGQSPTAYRNDPEVF
jgi:AraC family transcriptional regulator